MILAAIKESLLSFSSNRCLYESMMKYDFKIQSPRQNFMQLCFSSLAAWPLFVLLAVIYLDPTKNLWSLQKVFGEESAITLFLLDGQISTMLAFFFAFFFLEWILRKEYLFIGIIFYFLIKTDIHIHLALAGVLGVYFARACYLWWFHVDLESRSRKIWQTNANLILAAWVVAAGLLLYLLDFLQLNRFFSSSMSANRFEFLTLAVLINYAVAFLFQSIWGHFYARRKVEPSFLPIYYSTEKWILRFKMSSYLKKLLQERIAEVLPEHKNSAAQFAEIKDQSPGLGMNHLLTTLSKEISHLQSASSRLTIE